MAQGDLPTPRGSPRRRRREKRQLEQLAEASERHDAPRPSTAHVRVVEGQAPATVEARTETAKEELDREQSDQPIDGSFRAGSAGFHVRPVPIDQPIGE
jgi:hypothetical protein